MPGIPELHLAGFDGPMDQLLDLAERQRIDLGQISIVQLTEQFVAAMERLERHVAVEQRVDWLVMATRLLPAAAVAPAVPGQSRGRGGGAARRPGSAASRPDAVRSSRRRMAGLAAATRQGVFTRPKAVTRVSPPHGAHGPVPDRAVGQARAAGRGGAGLSVYRPAPMMLFRVDEAMTRIRALVAERQGENIDFVQCLTVLRSDDPLRELKARSAVARQVETRSAIVPSALQSSSHTEF